MPLIEVTIAAGRTEAQLRALVTSLTESAVRTVEARPEHVTVVVREVAADRFALGDRTVAERRRGA